MLEIPRQEVLRYLGFHGAVQLDDDTSQRIDAAIQSLLTHCSPRHLYRTFPLAFTDGFATIENTLFESHNLARNLKGCSEVVLFAATLGIEADRLIERARVRSMADVSILQAAAAAMIEAYCDDINQNIKDEALARGLHARPRYSPGYGDLKLESQKDFFALLKPEKETGITLSSSLIMVPTKSVTALIGLSSHDLSCIRQGCEECTLHETCAFSRTGGSL